MNMKINDVSEVTKDIYFSGVQLSILVSLMLVNGAMSTVWRYDASKKIFLDNCELCEVISLCIIKVLRLVCFFFLFWTMRL
jgi:hypothetical protein